MITKILFTIGVVLLVLMMARRRREGGRPLAAEPSRAGGRGIVRNLALAVVALMVLGGGLMLYLEWRDATEVVAVRVIDARSGRSVEYQAYRGEVEPRGFRTLDGRRVTLAETERMETSAAQQE